MKGKTFISGILICVTLTLFTKTTTAEAARAYFPFKSDDKHHYSHHPRMVKRLPSYHERISIHGISYYYQNGFFYRQASSGYVLINAPVGSVVPRVPHDCQTIILNGVAYYVYDNVYYVRQPSGYMVVETPALYTPATEVKVKTSTHSYVVNVPNANGSYTPVVIKKEGSAYIGPHGEYYSQSPTIEQLKVMYAK